jgi:hypothetical protein
MVPKASLWTVRSPPRVNVPLSAAVGVRAVVIARCSFTGISILMTPNVGVRHTHDRRKAHAAAGLGALLPLIAVFTMVFP